MTKLCFIDKKIIVVDKIIYIYEIFKLCVFIYLKTN